MSLRIIKIPIALVLLAPILFPFYRSGILKKKEVDDYIEEGEEKLEKFITKNFEDLSKSLDEYGIEHETSSLQPYIRDFETSGFSKIRESKHLVLSSLETDDKGFGAYLITHDPDNVFPMYIYLMFNGKPTFTHDVLRWLRNNWYRGSVVRKVDGKIRTSVIGNPMAIRTCLQPGLISYPYGVLLCRELYLNQLLITKLVNSYLLNKNPGGE